MKTRFLSLLCVGFLLICSQANASLPGLNIEQELLLQKIRYEVINGKVELAIKLASNIINDESLPKHKRFYFLMSRHCILGKDEEMIRLWIKEDHKCLWIYEHIYIN